MSNLRRIIKTEVLNNIINILPDLEFYYIDRDRLQAFNCKESIYDMIVSPELRGIDLTDLSRIDYSLTNIRFKYENGRLVLTFTFLDKYKLYKFLEEHKIKNVKNLPVKEDLEDIRRTILYWERKKKLVESPTSEDKFDIYQCVKDEKYI